MDKLRIFKDRLKKLNIDIEFVGNYPWIYIDKINGRKVVEKFQSNHGFCVGFLSVKSDGGFNFTDLTKIFLLIKMYV